LRAGIARGRSCASVLVVPQRKTTLGRALHGRAAMAGVGASMAGHGSAHWRVERGERRARLGALGGVAAMERSSTGLLLCSVSLTAVCEKKGGRRKEKRRERKEKKKGRKKRKGRKKEKISKLKNF
jgi:hypothetical protein